VIDGGVNGLDARPVVLPNAPLPAADGPGAQADGSDVEIALSESSFDQGSKVLKN
jgi:hypothetical protein